MLPLWSRLLTELARPVLDEATYRPPARRIESVVHLTSPLKPHEQRILELYRGNYFELYNHLLKYGTLPNAQTNQGAHWTDFIGGAAMGVGQSQIEAMAKGAIKVLQSLFARSAVTRDLVVYRGARSHAEFGGTPPWMVDGAPPDPETDRDLTAVGRFYAGRVTRFPKFLSTSRSIEGADAFNETHKPSLLWRFLVPEGSSALDLYHLSSLTPEGELKHPNISALREQEILFPPGCTATIVGAHAFTPTESPYDSDYWREAMRDPAFSYTAPEVNWLYDYLVTEAGAVNNPSWFKSIYVITATLTVPKPATTPFPSTEPTDVA